MNACSRKPKDLQIVMKRAAVESNRLVSNAVAFGSSGWLKRSRQHHSSYPVTKGPSPLSYCPE